MRERPRGCSGEMTRGSFFIILDLMLRNRVLAGRSFVLSAVKPVLRDVISLADLPASLRHPKWWLALPNEGRAVMVVASEVERCPTCRGGKLLFTVHERGPGQVEYACLACGEP